MKKLFLLFITLLLSFSAFAGISDDDIRGFFPKADGMPGGAELWLSTGIHTTKERNYTVYTNSYMYYSGKADTLLNIVRKKQYRTDVAVYSYNNFVDAADMFKQLTDDAPKKSSQMVRFGERGLFFIFPKSGYINDADFYLVFINRTFVVWIHADDGFAIMDVANPVNDAVKRFIADNPKLYMTKSLHIEADGDGFTQQIQKVNFTTDFPASIKVTGKVFDKKMVPQKGVTVTIKETGDTAVTDDEGNYSKTITLDGLKDIELSANFYLAPDKNAQLRRYDGGMSEVTLKTDDGSARTQLWKLDSVGDDMYGTAYINTAKGTMAYPISGKTLKGGVVALTLDCTNAGTDFKCSQSFNGTVKPGAITGKWTGTGGGGTFTADTDKYVTTTRRVMLTGDNASMGTYATTAGGYVRADSSNPTIAFVGGKSYGLYVKPDYLKLNIDEMMTVGASLVLTHLAKNQSGSLSVFVYNAALNGGKLDLGRGKYAGQAVTSDEPYKASFDVTGYLKNGFLLASLYETGNTGQHLYAGMNEQYDALKPYIEITEFAEKGAKAAEKPFTLSKKPVTGGDYVGDKNKPTPDGVDDVCFTGTFRGQTGHLTEFQIEVDGGMRMVFNTNPLDIYPAAAIIKDNEMINRKDGSLDMVLDGRPQTVKICVNGPYVPSDTDRVSYKYYFNGTPFEGLAE